MKSLIMVSLLLFSVGFCAAEQYSISESKLNTCIPSSRADWWPEYHESMLKNEPKDMKVMFLGDSITMMWRTQSGFEGGTPVWNKYYKTIPAGNYGISGDKTQHILWRITEGRDLEGTNPKIIILLVGINNLLQGDSPEDTAEGIKMIVSVLRKQLPKSKILLLGVFPSQPSPQSPFREKIKNVNTIIQKLADDKDVYFLDIGAAFLEKDGSISKTILRDYLHLSEKGYERWAEAMNPKLMELLKI